MTELLGPTQRATAVPSAVALDPRRLGVGIAVAGAIGMVSGMAVDAVLHARDASLIEREGLFTLTNVGHALLLVGAGLVVGGLLLALVGPALYGPAGGSPSPAKRVLQLTAPLVFVAVLVGVAAWGSNSSLAQGHPHDALADSAGPHDHAELTSTDGHAHSAPGYQPLDGPTQSKLIDEMARVREVTMRYPTVAAATAAGLRPVGPFAAGSGAHYLAPLDTVMGTLDRFDLERPIIYLFSGNDPTSTVVGVMYYVMNVSAPPDGFAGPNDVWHLHTGLCLEYTSAGIDLPLPVDGDVTADQCAAVGDQAMFMDVTGYMIHVWSAPGWESPDGVFAHDNTALTCADGRTAGQVTLHEGCQGR